MKRRIILFVATILFLSFAEIAFSQPPPPPGSGHGKPGNQPANGAPIGDGMLILIALGTAYGVKKKIDISKDKEEDLD